MYPEDRVLVAYVPNPADFATIQREGWYRIPQQESPKGLYAEYLAFYFGSNFGPQKWAIHYYAANHGHELATRQALLPHQPDHPRANDLYYKVQLGPLQTLPRPIISLRWRRITFLHTTWDRFQDAVEINDLFVDWEGYTDRLYATLRERGLQPERDYVIHEQDGTYELPLVIPCRSGRVDVTPADIPQNAEDIDDLADRILQDVEQRGGELLEEWKP